MKIAVALAQGKLGSARIEKLIPEIGIENVIGTARSAGIHKSGITIKQGNYDNPEDFKTAFKDIDIVLMVSGMDAPEKRIQQHRNVIEGAELNNIKKIVYTSIASKLSESAFNKVVQSNRQTEEDIKNSKLDWAIGRNGLYIEPDLDYIDTYIREGEIKNSAGNGKCGYTSHSELAAAYCKLILSDDLNKGIYNLSGEAITQNELAQAINSVYGTNLIYNAVSIEAYLEERKAALGDFLGTIISGIYHGISIGDFDSPSDFEKLVGRPHKSVIDMVKEFKNSD
jgi:NAD(P)H dehydrogenase (quinone)